MRDVVPPIILTQKDRGSKRKRKTFRQTDNLDRKAVRMATLPHGRRTCRMRDINLRGRIFKRISKRSEKATSDAGSQHRCGRVGRGIQPPFIPSHTPCSPHTDNHKWTDRRAATINLIFTNVMLLVIQIRYKWCRSSKPELCGSKVSSRIGTGQSNFEKWLPCQVQMFERIRFRVARLNWRLRFAT